MPLPTGLAPRPAPRLSAAQKRSTGFTLIETLVVLVVIGIALSGVRIGLDALDARDTEQALERLRAVLEATAERAEIRGEAIAVELLADAYRFRVRDADQRWRPLHAPPLFTERVLPAGVEWRSVTQDGRALEAPLSLVFGSRPPRFVVVLDTPAGTRRLEGAETGAVRLLRDES